MISKSQAAEFLDIWFTIRCPKCKTKNWVFAGDPDDLTKPDPESMKCFNCKTVSWIAQSIKEEFELNYEFDDSKEDIINNSYCVDGEKD